MDRKFPNWHFVVLKPQERSLIVKVKTKVKAGNGVWGT